MPAPTRPESGENPPQGVGRGSARGRVLVVGAGSSGLIGLRALLRAGLDAIAVEEGSRVGGLWVYENDTGHGRAYEKLTINTSVSRMELREHAMPREYGDFPSHTVIAQYFEDYARKFSLFDAIRFRTRVEAVRERADGLYEVTLQTREGESRVEVFDAVVVASGHHRVPLVPSIPGEFGGTLVHASEYRTPRKPVDVEGKRVVVVGFGNSAVDIATDLALRGNTRSVTLAARRGAWVLPKYLRGRPIDEKATIPLWLPGKLRRHIVTALFRLLHGGMEKFGLPTPDHLIGEAHPTISETLPGLVREGKIRVARGLVRLSGDCAHFEGGEKTEADVILFATGYRTEFPFLSEEHVRIESNTVKLFLRVFHPTHRRLFFVGLAQPTGAIFPLAELQAELIAEHLVGNYNLPDARNLAASIASDTRGLASRYVSSPRHSMQVDPELYERTLTRELDAGLKRSKRRSGTAFPSPLIKS